MYSKCVRTYLMPIYLPVYAEMKRFKHANKYSNLCLLYYRGVYSIFSVFPSINFHMKCILFLFFDHFKLFFLQLLFPFIAMR